MDDATLIAETLALAVPKKKGGLTSEEAAYMRGGVEAPAGSVPTSTSKFLNSPLFVHAYGLMSLRRMGQDVPCTYDIPTMSRALDDVADYAEAVQLIAAEKKKNLEFAAWLDERLLTKYDSSQMEHYADGTLGATIRDFIGKSGYKLDFINQGVNPAADLEYMIRRNGETHDIHHMATGFGPHMAGEQALSVMNLTCTANYFSPDLAGFISMPNLFVSSASFMRSGLNYRAGMPIMLEATRLGIEAGFAIKKPLMMVRWEDYLDWQLEDITADLGFKRGPGNAWLQHDAVLQG